MDNNNHRPKLKGSCQLIENIESVVRRLPGSMIIRDSGKRGDYKKWSKDRSPFFNREYLVPAGWKGLKTVVVGIKFHYDYREGLGRMEATHGGKFNELVEKNEQLKEQIAQILIGQKVSICPHCGRNIHERREGSDPIGSAGGVDSQYDADDAIVEP